MYKDQTGNCIYATLIYSFAQIFLLALPNCMLKVHLANFSSLSFPVPAVDI